MGLYDKEVKAAIGETVWDILCESGEVDGPQMKDITQQLSPKVLGACKEHQGKLGLRNQIGVQ